MAVTDQFERAVTRACLREVNRWLSLNPFANGDASAVRSGAFLTDIAREAGLSLPQARRRMKALQTAGRVLRSDTEGGRTRWWLVGLASSQVPIKPARQALTTSLASAVSATTASASHAPRQHWSDVLGVERDCSTSDATNAYRAELSRLNTLLVDQNDPEAFAATQRLKDAYNACCREHEIQIQE